MESVTKYSQSEFGYYVMKIEFTGYPSILDRVKAKGFKVFETIDYDLNIIGERNPRGTADQFDDWIHVLFLKDQQWQWHTFRATTDAGKHYLQSGNTAILVHDRQYRGVYMIGLHRGQYEALVQRGAEVCVWRDRNADLVHDMGENMECGYFGINIHRASAVRESESVDRYSAGCQVIANPDQFEHFMQLCKMQIEKTGFDRFTYTLLLGE